MQRHKKRPSIHDITRASIYPHATTLEKGQVRLALQEIVRQRRDMACTEDSGTDSVSSSTKSASSQCLPVEGTFLHGHHSMILANLSSSTRLAHCSACPSVPSAMLPNLTRVERGVHS